MNDTVSDLLARLQNGIIAKRDYVDVPVTKMVKWILDILKKEEMIVGYAEEEGVYTVELKYDNGEPVVTKFVRVSKPGLRKYVTSYELKPVMNGRGICIVSTSQGLMSGALAKSKKLGGELICEVW